MIDRIESVQRFYVHNFGCRASQADGAALEAALLGKGMIAAEEAASADVVVLNTCTVTASADEDARQAIRRVRRENPYVNILVTGCYAQRSPGDIAAMPGVTWVVGNANKVQIPEILTEPAVPYHGQVRVLSLIHI